VTTELGCESHALVSSELAAAVQLHRDAELSGDRQSSLDGLGFAGAVGRHDRLFCP
jgi:myosin-crossreactive antigen